MDIFPRFWQIFVLRFFLRWQEFWFYYFVANGLRWDHRHLDHLVKLACATLPPHLGSFPIAYCDVFFLLSSGGDNTLRINCFLFGFTQTHTHTCMITISHSQCSPIASFTLHVILTLDRESRAFFFVRDQQRAATFGG